MTFRTWRELTITSGRGPARHRSCQPNLAQDGVMSAFPRRRFRVALEAGSQLQRAFFPAPYFVALSDTLRARHLSRRFCGDHGPNGW